MKLLNSGAAIFLFAITLSGCKGTSENKNTVSIQENAAHQIGDVMASVDEVGGSGGAYSMALSEQKNFVRLAPEHFKSNWSSFLLPRAEAASCFLTNTWGSCSQNEIVRDFADCNIGGAVFSGTVTLSFADGTLDNTCTVDSDGDSISRVPDFAISSSQGAVYAVTKTGTIGQRITRTSAGIFAFSNDGIRRTVTYQGSALADFTTTTTTDLVVTGAQRNGRILNGGTIHVVNNLTSASCDFSPAAVAWNSSCNCPVSGSWSATCSDGKSGDIEITACGEGTFTLGESSESVVFDRCLSL